MQKKMGKIKISTLDTREFEFSVDPSYSIIFYQSDLIRIFNLLNSVNSKILSDKIKRIIFLRDYREGTITNLNKEITKVDMAKLTLSPLKYRDYINNQRDLDDKIEKYYKNKTIKL